MPVGSPLTSSARVLHLVVSVKNLGSTAHSGHDPCQPARMAYGLMSHRPDSGNSDRERRNPSRPQAPVSGPAVGLSPLVALPRPPVPPQVGPGLGLSGVMPPVFGGPAAGPVPGPPVGAPPMATLPVVPPGPGAPGPVSGLPPGVGLPGPDPREQPQLPPGVSLQDLLPLLMQLYA